jgi:predicted helicase
MASLLTKVLGKGPSVTASNLIPDLDYFCNRGARDIIPLWRDLSATDANITAGVLDIMSLNLGQTITAESFFAYCYAILASPKYVKKFWDELTIPGPRIPITKDAILFDKLKVLGSKLLFLHTYGERYVPDGNKPGKLPSGKVRCKVGTPSSPADYPEKFSYSYADQKLFVGKGVFENVRP